MKAIYERIVILMPKKKLNFDIATLKRNDISILTLDERWNKLFKNIPISREIKKRQDALNKLLAQEAVLFQEQKSIEPNKKKHMKNIISLTSEAFEKNNEQAKHALADSKLHIEQLNERAKELEDELFAKKAKIRESNFKLLEETVRYVYDVIEKSKKKEEKLEAEVDLLKKRLKDLQAQKQSITTNWTEIYSFFHNLLGSYELTKLDEQFIKQEVEQNADGNTH